MSEIPHFFKCCHLWGPPPMSPPTSPPCCHLWGPPPMSPPTSLMLWLMRSCWAILYFSYTLRLHSHSWGPIWQSSNFDSLMAMKCSLWVKRGCKRQDRPNHILYVLFTCTILGFIWHSLPTESSTHWCWPTKQPKAWHPNPKTSLVHSDQLTQGHWQNFP